MEYITKFWVILINPDNQEKRALLEVSVEKQMVWGEEYQGCIRTIAGEEFFHGMLVEKPFNWIQVHEFGFETWWVTDEWPSMLSMGFVGLFGDKDTADAAYIAENLVECDPRWAEEGEKLLEQLAQNPVCRTPDDAKYRPVTLVKKDPA